ncbi:MAG: membrane protein insertion efficiency factor YidD [Aureliella sp.]
MIAMVRLYQRAISPLLGPNCRFQPTCSEYMIESIRKRGLFVGMTRGIFRILKCHPFSRGGYDPP